MALDVSTSDDAADMKPVADLHGLAQRVLGPDCGTTLLETCAKQHRPAKAINKATNKQKRKRNPNRAKKAPSAFLLFSQAMRPILKEKIPNISFADMGRLLGQVWNATSNAERIPFQLLREQLPVGIDPGAEHRPDIPQQTCSELTAAAIVNDDTGGQPVPEMFSGAKDLFVVADESPMFPLQAVDFENNFKKPIRSLHFMDDLEDQKAMFRLPALEFFEGPSDSVFFDI